ncbi:MAG: hypothetical protein KF768_03040 [Phycisphaeraceae bacterium]|nr:hypothetical protein [Phycisphaeraceae bacterium]
MLLKIDRALLGIDHALLGIEHALLGIEHALLGIDRALLGIEHALLMLDRAGRRLDPMLRRFMDDVRDAEGSQRSESIRGLRALPRSRPVGRSRWRRESLGNAHLASTLRECALGFNAETQRRGETRRA